MEPIREKKCRRGKDSIGKDLICKGSVRPRIAQRSQGKEKQRTATAQHRMAYSTAQQRHRSARSGVGEASNRPVTAVNRQEPNRCGSALMRRELKRRGGAKKCRGTAMKGFAEAMRRPAKAGRRSEQKCRGGARRRVAEALLRVVANRHAEVSI